MKKAVILVLGISGLVHAMADDAALQRCRELREPAARLACYDAIPAAPASTPAIAAVARAPAAPAPAEMFGMESRRAPAGPPPEQFIESAIEGAFEGWLPRGQLVLANGQTWEIADDSTSAYRLQSPKVKITRGVSGSFFMAIEGVSQTPRVRRLR